MPQTWRSTVPDAEILRIAADIDRQGYGALAGYVSDDELAPLRSIAQAAVRDAGEEYVHFTGTAALAGTVLGALPQAAGFVGLCRRLYEIGAAEAPTQSDFYTIFRCLKGQSGQGHSNRFHYDSYVLTALLPVEIPDTGPRGDLIVIPSARRIRRAYARNVLDKLLVDNALSQRLLQAAAIRRRLGAVAIRLTPGTMYFFWGYRSVHANEACDPGRLRATALFHYGDPHRDSVTRRLLSTFRDNA